MTIMQKFSQSTEYNKIYELLVKDDRDFIGMIAYAIYKNEKRHYITSGEGPDTFVSIKSKPIEIKRYRNEAEEIVNNLLTSFTDRKISEIKKQISKEIISIASESLERPSKSKSFWKWHHGGAAGVIGNFYTAVIAAVFVLIFSTPETWKPAKDSALNLLNKIISNFIG